MGKRLDEEKEKFKYDIEGIWLDVNSLGGKITGVVSTIIIGFAYLIASPLLLKKEK